MEAKDTVMAGFKGNFTLEDQAEISFKAGEQQGIEKGMYLIYISKKKVLESMISRANAGLDALDESSAPYWKGYWKGLKDYGQAFLKEMGLNG